MSLNQKGWDSFINLCLSTNDESLLSDLFDMFFTSEEKENLALRCLIVKELLQQKRTQRQMAEDLHVSIAKITRGSNELKRISAQLEKYLQSNLGSKEPA